MRTANLRINQLSPEAFEWYLAYLKAVDMKDAGRYAAFLADDCVMRFNNNPPVEGKRPIGEALALYWSSFAVLEHDLLNIYGTDTSFMLEALNHYRRADGGAVTIPAVALTDRDEAGRVTSFRLYTDTAPLLAPSAA